MVRSLCASVVECSNINEKKITGPLPRLGILKNVFIVVPLMHKERNPKNDSKKFVRSFVNFVLGVFTIKLFQLWARKIVLKVKPFQ